MIRFHPGLEAGTNLDLVLVHEKRNVLSFALELAKHRTAVRFDDFSAVSDMVTSDSGYGLPVVIKSQKNRNRASNIASFTNARLSCQSPDVLPLTTVLR